MIDAEFRSEEKFTRLSLAYAGEDEKREVCSCVESILSKYEVKPELHSTSISDGREVLVIEYHDDLDRESGTIFEEIIQSLNNKVCN